MPVLEKYLIINHFFIHTSKPLPRPLIVQVPTGLSFLISFSLVAQGLLMGRLKSLGSTF